MKIMETIHYLYDTQGNQTALQIDLLNLNKQIGNRTSNINSAQIELLKLFANGFPDEYLVELKKILTNFLVEKILSEGDKVWDERTYTKETFDKFVEND